MEGGKNGGRRLKMEGGRWKWREEGENGGRKVKMEGGR